MIPSSDPMAQIAPRRRERMPRHHGAPRVGGAADVDLEHAPPLGLVGLGEAGGAVVPGRGHQIVDGAKLRLDPGHGVRHRRSVADVEGQAQRDGVASAAARSTTATWWPCAARRAAQAAPIPELPPVTSAADIGR